jgi:hypothetical protein
MAEKRTLRRDRDCVHQRHESDAPRDGKRPGPSENPVTLSRYSNGAACVRTRSELTEGCGGRPDCQSAAPIGSRPEGPGDSTNADALVRLAMDAQSRPAPCARTRVETMPPIPAAACCVLDVQLSRTRPGNQDECPRPMQATGSDQQQHACHPARASVSATGKATIARAGSRLCWSKMPEGHVNEVSRGQQLTAVRIYACRHLSLSIRGNSSVRQTLRPASRTPPRRPPGPRKTREVCSCRGSSSSVRVAPRDSEGHLRTRRS